MEIRIRDIKINGSVDISVVAIMTNVSRRLIYLEKEISFSCDLLFFSVTILLSIRQLLLSFFFLFFFFDPFRTNYYTLYTVPIASFPMTNREFHNSNKVALFFDALICAVYQEVSINESFAFITRAYLNNLKTWNNMILVII